MADVFEELVLEKGGESGSSFGIARRTDASLFAAECQKALASAPQALEPGEARFDRATIEVASDDGIDETAPIAVFFLEALLPQSLDVLVVGLEKLIKGGGPSVAGAVEGGSGALLSRGEGWSCRKYLHTS